ncbi:DUF397 domain-containing protein [Streptomyces clavuligerus]|uniref:Putative regulatory protein n=1 Tax=Streptomyces clavuligerus TaxID=1901 RepID=B5GPW4_STRCL|nr:DUF397 domain-containing protein [Streptomyces clavuligerus]ANW19783.1 DUF397 domain-containing protein [Streptomyces clavuligerus]AXU14398.1 DUF397 domain-containing protein [Streptomyces clavuligerus]EDY48360.1 regulatory protein [Streptomyces clavuligerus]EFG07366.1 Putative regulatory protein [Streptomyces clavuligerus]MBY6304405.1 DUF397 domain-containing protein [Streptomyces clavuligerus]
MITARDLNGAVWRKSSYSNSESASCVEVADGYPGLTPVRDSKVPHGPALLIGTEAWTTFVHHLST